MATNGELMLLALAAVGGRYYGVPIPVQLMSTAPERRAPPPSSISTLCHAEPRGRSVLYQKVCQFVRYHLLNKRLLIFHHQNRVQADPDSSCGTRRGSSLLVDEFLAG